MHCDCTTWSVQPMAIASINLFGVAGGLTCVPMLLFTYAEDI